MKTQRENYTAVMSTYTLTDSAYQRKLTAKNAKIKIPRSSPAARQTL
jgi:hypothetical protein